MKTIDIIKRLNNVFNNGSRNSPTGSTSGRGWYSVSEPFTGAWQKNISLSREDLSLNHAAFACMTLIASDCAKLGLKLVKKNGSIWEETTSNAYSPVLKKPNKYQNRIQFIENWVLSVLQTGNCYILKRRDLRGVVVELYILDSQRCKPLVSDSGDVFYELSPDELSTVKETVIVPASEIIHDRSACLFHPLVGISPLNAASIPMLQARSISDAATSFFQNNARPGGILTAPGAVSSETVDELRAHWESNYSGNNAGKVAILADGLQYKSFDVASNANSQVFEQLKWSETVVCSVFHVPPYKVGIQDAPNSLGVESLNLEYYSQAIQSRLESMELCLSEGLNLPNDYFIEFDVSNLLRMDSASLITFIKSSSGILTVNEQRAAMSPPRGPVVGGDSPMVQMQNFSLSALAKRDAKDDPFEGKATDSEIYKLLELTSDLENLKNAA